ncbi:MAG: hypothetical protein P8183_16235 [Anaerolineae bacterium]
MKKITAVLLMALILIFTLAACGGSEDQGQPAAGDAVQAAADAFVEGFDNHDLTQFDTFFAPPGDNYDMSQTQDAAHQAVANAAPGTTFQIDKLKIQNTQAGSHPGEVVVTYQAQVSMWDNGQATFTAVVTQDVALQQINGKWLITGGDAPHIQTNEGAPTS